MSPELFNNIKNNNYYNIKIDIEKSNIFSIGLIILKIEVK